MHLNKSFIVPRALVITGCRRSQRYGSISIANWGCRSRNNMDADEPVLLSMVDYGDEVESDARLVANHPSVASGCDFESAPRRYLRLVSGQVSDPHTAGDDVADVIFRILACLRPGV